MQKSKTTMSLYGIFAVLVATCIALEMENINPPTQKPPMKQQQRKCSKLSNILQVYVTYSNQLFTLALHWLFFSYAIKIHPIQPIFIIPHNHKSIRTWSMLLPIIHLQQITYKIVSQSLIESEPGCTSLTQNIPSNIKQNLICNIINGN